MAAASPAITSSGTPCPTTCRNPAVRQAASIAAALRARPSAGPAVTYGARSTTGTAKLMGPSCAAHRVNDMGVVVIGYSRCVPSRAGDKLEKYRAMRDFAVTAEPAGG